MNSSKIHFQNSILKKFIFKRAPLKKYFEDYFLKKDIFKIALAKNKFLKFCSLKKKKKKKKLCLLPKNIHFQIYSIKEYISKLVSNKFHQLLSKYFFLENAP